MARKFLRWLALSAAVGGTSYAAFGPFLHAVTSVNTAISGLTNTARTGHTVIVARARLASPVTAKHGVWTAVELTGASWMQPAGAVHLLAGTMKVRIPDNCTGSIGNALSLSVDGDPVTFAAAPTAPGTRTVTLPFLIGTLGDPDEDTKRTLSARFGSSCAAEGEDYIVSSVKIDVLEFR